MFQRLLIANRGEIALRIMRAAADLEIGTVAVFAPEDAAALHVRRADRAVPLHARGARAYLDIDGIVTAALDSGCDAVHPGYGFLAENAAFARRVTDAGLTFVGPRAELLERFGDKTQARALAAACGVPVLAGSEGATSLVEAEAFFRRLPAGAGMVIKAVAGGGGRGMRVVRNAAEIVPAWERCASEALAAFGSAALYVERLVERARHLEVQVLGDQAGNVAHLWERECTLQRRHQKLVELAPAPSLDPGTRAALIDAALAIARAAGYENLGTMEFLLDDADPAQPLVFIEANARLQVEHTVTEEVTGIDLVRAQLELAAGRSLAELGLGEPPTPRGCAIQVRVNMETMQEDGSTRPAAGTLTAFDVPTGRGVRVETFGYAGFTTSPAFDSLLAKVIVHEPTGDLARTLRRVECALAEFRIEGVATNTAFLRALLSHPDVLADTVHTRFVEAETGELTRRAAAFAGSMEAPAALQAGRRIDSADPLAVLRLGRDAERPGTAPAAELAPGLIAVNAPMQGTVVSVEATEGAQVEARQLLVVMEAMKMEHVIEAPVAGTVRRLNAAPGDTLFEGHRLLVIEPGAGTDAAQTRQESIDLDRIRADLAEVRARHAFGLDENRPEAVARRHARGHRTARENIADLVDPGSFVEYGPLMVAAQRRRRTLQDLMEKTSGDGMVAGIGCVNGDLFGREHSRVMAMTYDYMVLAGTQGHMNRLKKDRLFRIAEENRLPVVLLAEGGGGRPGDTDGTGVAGLDCYAFNYFARLSGLAPLVGITNGYCFAGNAALLGCCDVIIATEGSNIGMGGPAMVEGGGLGVYRPDEIGPLDVHVENGVVDIAVPDEAAAVAAAKQYLGYFQGRLGSWSCDDQRTLRHLIPENRLRVYEVRRVIEHLADTGSVLELRRGYGHGMVTALARVEGRPIGILANNPAHLGGAIDSPAADKAARFIQLCDAFDIPMLFLCDTPGFMVGPEAEKTAQVRRFARMFVTAANVSVPFFTIILRKGYGLGAQAMAGGSFKVPLFTISWPTGEFGGMGLEGAVKLGYRNELEAIADPAERKKTYDEMVARMYERGKAVSMAAAFEIDEVIDPADSRTWIMAALESAPVRPRLGKKRPHIDTW
ncbi:MAG: carbamoyl-phosphate synthase large subunit [Pseudomonadales bacterium]|nr:carbamoyl-phosphate synthase large subunit [Pseudomonadales bacterium]